MSGHYITEERPDYLIKELTVFFNEEQNNDRHLLHKSRETCQRLKNFSNFFKSMNNGTITIHIDNELFLRLTLTYSDIDRIKLEFGQKFLEETLMIGLDRLFDAN